MSRSSSSAPLVLGSLAVLGVLFFKSQKAAEERKKTVDSVFMQAQASNSASFVKQAIVVMRAAGNEPAARILEIHLSEIEAVS